jgi:tape measure domain-containing protein
MAEKRLVYRIGADNSELKAKFEEVRTLAGSTGKNLAAIGSVRISTANLAAVKAEIRTLQAYSVELRAKLLNAVPGSQAAQAYASGLAMVEERMRQLQTLSSQVSKQLTDWGTRTRNIGAGLTIGVTAPLTLAGRNILQTGIEMDSLKRGLGAVSGSAQETEQQLLALREVAKLPGLGFKEAISGSVNLQAAGYSAEEAAKNLMEYGNALATVGKGKAELDMVNVALVQLANRTSGFGQEIRQLQNHLPQIRELMKKAFGTADPEMIGDMGITGKEFVQALLVPLSQLPRVTGGIRNDFENMADATERAMAAAEKAVEPTISSIANTVTNAATAFETWDPAAQKAVVALGAVALAAGPVLTVTGQLANIAAYYRLRAIAKATATLADTVETAKNSAATSANTAAVGANTASQAANTASVQTNALAIRSKTTALALNDMASDANVAANARLTAANAAATASTNTLTGSVMGLRAAWASLGLLAKGGIVLGITIAATQVYQTVKAGKEALDSTMDALDAARKDAASQQIAESHIAESLRRREKGLPSAIKAREMGMASERDAMWKATADPQAAERNAKDELEAAKVYAKAREIEWEAFGRQARESMQWAKALTAELWKLKIARDQALRDAKGPKEKEAIGTLFGAKEKALRQDMARESAKARAELAESERQAMDRTLVENLRTQKWFYAAEVQEAENRYNAELRMLSQVRGERERALAATKSDIQASYRSDIVGKNKKEQRTIWERYQPQVEEWKAAKAKSDREIEARRTAAKAALDREVQQAREQEAERRTRIQLDAFAGASAAEEARLKNQNRPYDAGRLAAWTAAQRDIVNLQLEARRTGEDLSAQIASRVALYNEESAAIARDESAYKRKMAADEAAGTAEAKAIRQRMGGRDLAAMRTESEAERARELAELDERARLGENVNARVEAAEARHSQRLADIAKERRRRVLDEKLAGMAASSAMLSANNRPQEAAEVDAYSAWVRERSELEELARTGEDVRNRMAAADARYYQRRQDIAAQSLSKELSEMSLVQGLSVRMTELTRGRLAADLQALEFERQARRQDASEQITDASRRMAVLDAIDADYMARRRERMGGDVRWTNVREMWETAMVAGARTAGSFGSPQMRVQAEQLGMLNRINGTLQGQLTTLNDSIYDLNRRLGNL